MIDLIFETGKRSTTVTVPQSWNELTGEQLQAVALVLFTEDVPVLRDLRLIMAITGLQPHQLAAMDAAVVWEQLLPLVEWLKTDCNLTTQVLQEFTGKRVKYCGPADYLANLRLGEFDFTERALYHWYNDTADIKRLYAFIAILYRPARKRYDRTSNPDGDNREPFNANMTAQYAKCLMRHMPLSFAYSVLLFYKGCRDYITERHSRIFSGGSESDTPAEPGYFPLIRMIAKDGTHGNFSEVEQMFIYNAFEEMECAIDDRERIEEEIEKLKTGQK